MNLKLKLPKAALIGMRVKLRAQMLTSIEVQCPLSTSIADVLGVRWVVLDKTQEVRGGFKKIELDETLEYFANVRYSSEGVPEALNLTGVRCHKFSAVRVGNKKKGKRLLLNFHMDVGGSPLSLLEYCMKIAGYTGELVIEQEQPALPGVITGQEVTQ